MNKKTETSRIRKKRAKTRKKKPIGKIFLKIFLLFFVIAIIGAGASAFIIYNYLTKDLPKIYTLWDYKPSVITTVYSDNGEKIGEFFKERRIVKHLHKLPSMLIDAFIAAEDSRFFEHEGIDFLSIFRAFFKNIEAGEIVQGGSTITQQVTKSFFLSPERSYSRKIKEAALAYRIEKTFSKEEILFLYLNQIYLGHGAYGVEAASENYFDKSAKDLNLAECAILAGLPQAPSRYSPFKNEKLARQRQIYVLNRMLEDNNITAIQMEEAKNVELDIKPRKNLYIEKTPFYTEHILVDLVPNLFLRKYQLQEQCR